MGKKFVARGVTTIAGASLTSEARKWRRRRRRRTDLERPPPTFSSMTVGGDIISAASGVSLQKARSWDEGVASNFSSTPLRDIFKDKKVVIFGLPGAYTRVCSKTHVPSYKNNIDLFKAKGIDSVICVPINDPYTLNGWAERLEAKDVIEFYGDFNGSFHKSIELDVEISAALLGCRSQRWSAYVVDGKVKALNVEKWEGESSECGESSIRCQGLRWRCNPGSNMIFSV